MGFLPTLPWLLIFLYRIPIHVAWTFIPHHRGQNHGISSSLSSPTGSTSNQHWQRPCPQGSAVFGLSRLVVFALKSDDGKKPDIMQFPHSVFGYGSLICPDSRAITAPTVADRSVLPVSIKGVERTWAKKSQTSKATSMGVRFRNGAKCVGVLVPVDDKELKAFDEREVGYDRNEIRLEDIESVTHLLGDDESGDIYENTFLDQSIDTLFAENIPRIWIYVQQNQVPATPQYPIAQSYVDIMLRGCLTISEKFAAEFIETTKGWNPADLVFDDDENSDGSTNMSNDGESESDGMELGWWVDDRTDPLYVRADSEYSLRNQRELDNLLKEKIPSKISARIRRGKS